MKYPKGEKVPDSILPEVTCLKQKDLDGSDDLNEMARCLFRKHFFFLIIFFRICIH